MKCRPPSTPSPRWAAELHFPVIGNPALRAILILVEVPTRDACPLRVLAKGADATLWLKLALSGEAALSGDAALSG